MFPLAGTTFPTSADELAAGLRDALAEVFWFPNRDSVVKVEGGAWPVLDQLRVDLSDASIKITQPPLRPEPSGKRDPGIVVNHFEVIGHPIRHERNALDLSVEARAVKIDFARDAGKALLVLTDAADGHLDLNISQRDLQAVLLAGATMAAGQQGVAVQDLQLNLTSQGPRTILGDVRIKARKMMMSGAVTVRGRVDIDDALVATLSNLACAGEGMIGGMAAAMISGKLKALNGRQFPLMAFALGDVSLRDLKMTITDAVRITADFGRER